MDNFSKKIQPGHREVDTMETGLPTLPIGAHEGVIIESIQNSPSSVLVGETGSGKTTKTPLFLLKAFPDARIAVTSPRVLPARSVSKYVASRLGERVGDTVGVITREKREVGPDTRCLFMTDGLLLSMLRKDPALEDLDIVMVDEAHERGLNVDFSLGLLKRAQKLRTDKGLPDLKIIVASATLEEEKFTRYFSNSPLVKVPGRMFPVEVSYHPYDGGMTPDGRVKDYTDQAAVITSKILEDQDKDGDILIFMPGEAEIMRTIGHLEKVCGDDVDILPLFGSMNPKDQDLIFEKNGRRKVIVATNIAETSVTIDTVRHVIDTGYNKQKQYDPATGIDSLALRDAAQANMEQRKGRAGRVSSGWCYRLISKDDFEGREAFVKPEILRSNLAEVVLKMKDMGIDDVEGFEFIDPPSKIAVHDAVQQLKKLGALDEEEKITSLGKEMVELPLEPGLARAVIEAKRLNCLELMIDVAAMFSTTKQLFFRPRNNDPDSSNKEHNQQGLRVTGSDYLTALNVWRKWVEADYSTQFAVDHLVNVKALREAGQVRDLLLRSLGETGVENVTGLSQSEESQKITQCLLVSKPESVFYGHPSDRGWTVWSAASEKQDGRMETSIFPGSSCFKNVDESQLLLGEDLNKNDKGVTYIRRCHAITFEDLKKNAPHLIQEKEEMDTYGRKKKVTYINGVEVKRESIYEDDYAERSRRLASSWGSQASRGYERSPYPVYQERIIDAYDVGQLLVGNETLYACNERMSTRAKHYADRNRNIKLKLVDWRVKVNSDIASGRIKTLDDVKTHIDDYVVTFDTLVTQEEQAETDQNSPDYVMMGSVTVPVIYQRNSYLYNLNPSRVATVSFDLDKVTKIMKDASTVFDINLPLVDKVVYEYVYYAPSEYSETPYQTTKQCATFKELVSFAMTNRFEADTREKITVSSGGMSKEEREQLFSSGPVDTLYSLQGTIDTKEKKERLATRISVLRGLLAIIDPLIAESPESKTKNKVLAQLLAIKKELRQIADKVEAYKGSPIKAEIPLQVIEQCEKLITGNDVLSMLKILDKRYLGLVYANIASLEQAARDGDVELTEEVMKKILHKSFTSLLGTNPVKLTEDDANNSIIELI